MSRLQPSAQTLRRLRRSPLLSRRRWARRTVVWGGAVLVALVAIAFAQLADWASAAFVATVLPRPYFALLITPAGLALAVLLTQRVFPGAQGSGIPQVIASMHIHDPATVARVLSLRIASGKVMLTLLGLLSGASIGREGPTVQVGASVMQALGARFWLPRAEAQPGRGPRRPLPRLLRHQAARDDDLVSERHPRQHLRALARDRRRTGALAERIVAR